MKQLMAVLLALMLGACASYSGRGLQPDSSRLEDVLRVMGQPAMRWQDADGSLQLAYPRGPMGTHTFMVHVGADGKMRGIENVLAPKFFARVRPGMTKPQVLRLLGPSEVAWSVYFKARDELVWEWRYCDEWNELARFDVLFDGGKETVRSSMSQTEQQMGLCGEGGCMCGH